MIGAALNLKRGAGRDAHVVLVPQPSDDPNDPCVYYSLNNHLNHYQHRLNWPHWKKQACFWTLYVCFIYQRALDGNLNFIIPGHLLRPLMAHLPSWSPQPMYFCQINLVLVLTKWHRRLGQYYLD